jgi:hypothetical protein
MAHERERSERGNERGKGRLATGVLAGDIEKLNAAAEVRDDDGAADDERDIEGFEELFIGDAAADALINVVGDAVITAEDHGGDQAKKFFGLLGQMSIFVAGAIETEETLHVEGGADGSVCRVIGRGLST